jgi:hemoglobin
MSDAIPESQVYATIGEDGFADLVAAFYRRVRGDDVLAPLYPQHDLDAAEVRLCEFLIQRFGGPSRYSATRGHPRLRMRHAPFKVDQRARDRRIELMEAALAESNLPAPVAAVLRPYFHETATFMINTAE